MKKTYFNPEATIFAIACEDILTTSGGPLDVVQGAADGYDDADSITNMFG